MCNEKLRVSDERCSGTFQSRNGWMPEDLQCVRQEAESVRRRRAEGSEELLPGEQLQDAARTSKTECRNATGSGAKDLYRCELQRPDGEVEEASSWRERLISSFELLF